MEDLKEFQESEEEKEEQGRFLDFSGREIQVERDPQNIQKLQTSKKTFEPDFIARMTRQKEDTLLEEVKEMKQRLVDGEPMEVEEQEEEGMMVFETTGQVRESTEQFPRTNFENELRKTQPEKFNIQPFVEKQETALTSGLNLKGLRAKYKPKELTLQQKDYELFQEENEDNIFGKTAVTNAMDLEENLEAFEQEKLEALEEDLPKQEKQMKGWGEWTGHGVQEKPVDHAKEERERQMRIVS